MKIDEAAFPRGSDSQVHVGVEVAGAHIPPPVHGQHVAGPYVAGMGPDQFVVDLPAVRQDVLGQDGVVVAEKREPAALLYDAYVLYLAVGLSYGA